MLYFQQSIGIDIRENYLRAAHLGMGYKGVELINGLIEPLPFNVDEFPRESELKIIETLREFVRGYHDKLDDVIIGLPRKKIVFKEIALPAVEKENLKEMLGYELENHIPFSVEDVYYDYHLIGRNDENSMKLFLVAVKRDTLDWYLDILSRVDLSPTVIEITSFAVYNLSLFNATFDHNELAASVEINRNNIEVNIIESGELKLTRSIDRIGQGLEKWFLDEGLMKSVSNRQTNEPGQFISMQINEETKTLGDDIIFELIHTIDSSRSEAKKELSRIVICGLEKADGNMSGYLSRKAEVNSSIIDPLARIGCDNEGLRQKSELCSAVGLALRGMKEQPISINLLPIGLKQKKKRNIFITTGVLLAVLLSLFVSTVVMRSLKDSKELKLLEQEIAKLMPEVEEVNKLQSSYEDLSKQIQGLKQLEEGKITKVEILKELTDIIPQNVWLHKFDFSDDTIQISGYATSGSEQLIQTLENSPLFEQVKSSKPTITRKGQEEFSIKAVLEGIKKQEINKKKKKK